VTLHLALTARRPSGVAFLVTLTTLILLASFARAEDFFGQQESGGGIRVVDSGGVEVPVVMGDPVGTRPDSCPTGSYYFTELASDKAQIVLSDCATGNGSYPVQLLGSSD
jgi:hypothetical protein